MSSLGILATASVSILWIVTNLPHKEKAMAVERLVVFRKLWTREIWYFDEAGAKHTAASLEECRRWADRNGFDGITVRYV